MTPILFINIGWMTAYKGPTATDRPAGGFGYLKDGRAVGHEAWNFAPIGGKVYGYVPRSSSINIRRLGATPTDASISGVTVVWIARKTKENKTYIVGWYRNATVYANAGQKVINRSANFPVDYHVFAPSNEATLLGVDQRTFQIPTSKETGNLGQSPVWYGKSDDFRSRVLKYIEAGGATGTPAKGGKGKGWLADVELRQKIERAAIEHATSYYSSVVGGSRTVTSVERDARGWDLEAVTDDGAILKVEVKGLLGSDIVVDVTPNEYAKMKSVEHRPDYVVYIVANALKATAKAHIFRFSGVSKGYVVFADDTGRELKVAERTAARLSL